MNKLSVLVLSIILVQSNSFALSISHVICGQTKGVTTQSKTKETHVHLGLFNFDRVTTETSSGSEGGEFAITFKKPLLGSVNIDGRVELTEKAAEKKISRTYGFRSPMQLMLSQAAAIMGPWVCAETLAVGAERHYAFGSGQSLEEAKVRLESLRDSMLQ